MERELNNIGVIYSVQGQYAEALDYLLQNAKIREELGDKLGTVEALHFIGGVYLLKGDYAQALALEQKAAQQAEALGNNELLSGSLRNISEAYLRLNQYQPAREYAERAASVASRAAIPDVLWNVKAIAGKARCKSSSGSWAQSCSNSAAVISNAWPSFENGFREVSRVRSLRHLRGER